MIIQIVLIVAVLVFFAYYLRSRGSKRSSAVFKLLFIAFGLFAIYTVLRPNDLTAIANAIGVDRGTDLMLYALVVTFGFTTVGTYLRFREMEGRYTRLVRAIALQGAEIRSDDGEGAPGEAAGPGTAAGSGTDGGSAAGSGTDGGSAAGASRADDASECHAQSTTGAGEAG